MIRSSFFLKNSDSKNKPNVIKDPKTKKEAKSTLTAVFLSKDAGHDSSEWYIDSGCSQHMTPFENLLTQSEPTAVREICAANNGKMSVSGLGKVSWSIDDREIDVNDVLCVPELTVNLLSVAQMVKSGNKVIFDQNGCSIIGANEECIVKVQPVGGVYKFNVKTSDCMLTSATSNNAATWHRRLGHLNYADLCRMKNGIVDGIKFNDGADEIKNCVVCKQGKHSRPPFK